MLDGFGYLFGQISLLLGLAVVVGIVVGRYAWPRRVVVGSLAEEDGATNLGLAGGSVPVSGALDAETRFPIEPAAESGAPHDHPDAALAARLAQVEVNLAEARRRVNQTNAELLRMRMQAQALADEKEAEMGRLESGAIAALDSTIAAHREREAGFEAELRLAQETTRRQEEDLDGERRRSAQLQAALAERDEHLAALMADRSRGGSASPETAPGR